MRNILIPTESSHPRARITTLALQSFAFLFVLTGLGAYNVGPIPVSWLAQSGFIALAVGVIFTTNRFRPVPGMIFFFLFMIWALIVTTIHLDEFSGRMPPMTLMPYWAYVSFRYINLISFASALYVTYWLVGEGEGEAVVRWIVVAGLIISVISLYIYFAPMLGLPEPARNRAGTTGGKQVTNFSGEGGLSYKRAIGTFREPSGLADWLMLPFFLSFAFPRRIGKIRSAIITITMVLTVSMMGLFSVVSGTLAALLLTRPFSKRTYKSVGTAIAIGGLIFLLLNQVTLGVIGANRVSLGSIVSARVQVTLFGGVRESNRAYVYYFMDDNPFPPLGMGMGNGNLLFSNLTQNDVITAFLSLYLFTLYSTGYPGMILLGAFLARPIIQYVFNFRRTIGATPLVLMAYIGHLAVSFAGPEEVSPWLGMSAALLACEAHRLSIVGKAFRSHFAKTTRGQRVAVTD